jgi:hypothetical protein
MLIKSNMPVVNDSLGNDALVDVVVDIVAPFSVLNKEDYATRKHNKNETNDEETETDDDTETDEASFDEAGKKDPSDHKEDNVKDDVNVDNGDVGINVDDGNEDDDDDDSNENDDSVDDGDEDYIDAVRSTAVKKQQTKIIFTNGLGLVCDEKKKLTAIIESAKQRKLFADAHHTGNEMRSLIERWSRKPPHNHCADILYSVGVVAKEVGFDNPLHLCHTRGWMVRLRKDGDVNIQYKRFRECLQDVPGGEKKAFHLKGIVSSLYGKLDTTMLRNGNQNRRSIKSPNKKGSSAAAAKRKSTKVDINYEMVHAHDEASFFQRVNQNTKCLQIAFFLVNFIFSPFFSIALDTELILSVFGGAYSSRRWVELCQGLLVLFDGPVPNKEEATALHSQLQNNNLDVYDYVMGKVSFAKDNMLSLHLRIKEEILATFKRSSLSVYANRKSKDQLVIMRHVVLKMFKSYKGNEIDSHRSSMKDSSKSSSRKPLSDPMFPAVVAKPSLPAGTPAFKKRKVDVIAPTVIDVSVVVSPSLANTNLSVQVASSKALPSLPPDEDDFFLDTDARFNPKNVRLATPEEVISFAPRVYVEGAKFETSLYCAPIEFYLLRNLRNLFHGFTCDSLGLVKSITKQHPTLEIPMACSYITDDFSVIRSGHPIFGKAFAKDELVVNLALCLRFVVEHGTSNKTRDGVASTTRDHGSRIDFGCAGSSHKTVSPGVYRPDLLCSTDVFECLGEHEREQIKQSIATVYDCMAVATNAIQDEIGAGPMYAYKPRDNVYGSTLRNFLGANVMANEWCTLQAKCITNRERTERHKDIKNCVWLGYDKTGALCFMIVDAMGTLWSLKFLSNSRQVIGSYFDELLGVETLCLRITKHLKNVDLAYETLLKAYDGTTSHELNWKNPWGFFLNDHCPWTDTKDNEAIYRAIILPTIVVRDFWMSPAVHIVTEMRSLGLKEEELLELILIGGYQTSWFRFFYIGRMMIHTKALKSPFETYVSLALEKFGSITGGPYRRAEPPGINIKTVYLSLGDCNIKQAVIACILVLLRWVNDCSEESFDHASVRDKVLETSLAISNVHRRTELGEFRLMLILQMCALSQVVLHPSPKLLHLLYPIPGKGSANHLLDVGVAEENHQDALKRVMHHFNLNDFGDNAGESILCETLPGRNVFDAFFHGQDLFLMNKEGKSQRKRYGRTVWESLDQSNAEDA